MFASNTSAANGGATYIEDVFSTWLYTGNGSTQTITNGIDLSTKGGLVWIKQRNGVNKNVVNDTQRGATKEISTNETAAEITAATGLTSFNTNGFSLGSRNAYNGSALTFASWTFRKQPKFFDVVTYTGNGTGQTISHNLGSVPGCIIIKEVSGGASAGVTNWAVYHRSLGNTDFAWLNSTAAKQTSSGYWNNTSPTSTAFTVGSTGNVNESGGSFVAYLFAHDAGGFGLTGTDNVISCGSYTTDASGNATVNLGYEPQFVMYKFANSTSNWVMLDTMRGLNNTNDYYLVANTSDAEQNWGAALVKPTATGFTVNSMGGAYNIIYIAIRRGPMKVPTSGTSVLGLNARTGTSANATVTGGAGVTDLAIIKRRNSTSNWVWTPRLTGTGYLSSNLTAAETAAGTTILQANPWDVMDGIKVGTTSTLTNASGSTFINYLIDRAPGFMDVVCYTGTGSATTVTHNLAAVPELMIVKERSAVNGWPVYASTITDAATGFLLLNSTDAFASPTAQYWNNTAPTSSVFTVGTNSAVNASTQTFVAYLFATCAGVSKVGSYTGNGSTQTINCGFTGGARFVLIKNTSAVENWQIFDTARGMVAGTDPELRPNKTDTEVNVSNMVYTATTGFELVTSNAVVNGTGNSYIFLAIA